VAGTSDLPAHPAYGRLLRVTDTASVLLAGTGAGLGRRMVLPGHGPDLADLEAVASGYLAHREQRLEQVWSALRDLGDDATARQIVEHVDVDEKLWHAAESSVQAQLDYLHG
jgi:glyoxylase-like metal-dependent hydrolase (beta-lactamase superfamily II)